MSDLITIWDIDCAGDGTDKHPVNLDSVPDGEYYFPTIGITLSKDNELMDIQVQPLIDSDGKVFSMSHRDSMDDTILWKDDEGFESQTTLFDSKACVEAYYSYDKDYDEYFLKEEVLSKIESLINEQYPKYLIESSVWKIKLSAEDIEKLISEYDYQKESLSCNQFYDEKANISSFVISFTTNDGDNRLISARFKPDISMETIKDISVTGSTPMLIDANKCIFDEKHLGQWTYNDENIWEYEVPSPRSDILCLASKDKLLIGDIEKIVHYYNNYNFGNEIADGLDFDTLIVKEMIKDGFSKARISLIGKDFDAAKILYTPEIKNFYSDIQKSKARLGKSIVDIQIEEYKTKDKSL